uniref:Ergosterol biosynthesis 28 homolog n=1 Tax=Oryzias sinensis TaxID=183150 RepID=A0A8C7YAG2_9TELE
MSRFLNVLRSWLVMVSVIAMGNTVQSFRDHSFLSEKLYTGTPEFVNGLQARTFGIWTLLSSIIRCACAIDIQNRTLYHITLWTFVLALGHFLSEAFIYKTAPLTIGVMAPLIVASEYKKSKSSKITFIGGKEKSHLVVFLQVFPSLGCSSDSSVLQRLRRKRLYDRRNETRGHF